MRIVCAAAQSQFPEAFLSTVKAYIAKNTVFVPCIQECKVLASLWVLFTATEDTQLYAFSFKLPQFSDSHDSCRFVGFLFFFFFRHIFISAFHLSSDFNMQDADCHENSLSSCYPGMTWV